MLPKYEFGDEVRIIRNVRNDGTYPGVPTGQLLIRRGSTGFVTNVGTFLQDQLIYTVNFVDQNKIVGFREEELIGIAEPWVTSQFESREKVRSKITLAVRGEVRVTPGMEGEILKVFRDESAGVLYHVIFHDQVLQVPESALEAVHVYHDDNEEDPPFVVSSSNQESGTKNQHSVRGEPDGTTSHSTKPASGQVAGYVEP